MGDLYNDKDFEISSANGSNGSLGEQNAWLDFKQGRCKSN
jgi:hypothetical protein